MIEPTAPFEIVSCAVAIERWMKEQNIENWKLLGLCSRSTAERLETQLAEAERLLRRSIDATEEDGIGVIDDIERFLGAADSASECSHSWANIGPGWQECALCHVTRRIPSPWERAADSAPAVADFDEPRDPRQVDWKGEPIRYEDSADAVAKAAADAILRGSGLVRVEYVEPNIYRTIVPDNEPNP